MSLNRLKHWTPRPTPVTSTVAATSTRDRSMVVPTIPVHGPDVAASFQLRRPLDLNKPELAFPPVRQPSNPLRRPTRRINAGRERPVFLCEVSPRVYSLLWLLVLLLHTACAMYLCVTGGSQFYLLGTSLLGYLTLYGVTVDAFYLPPIGVGYFMVCGLHAYSVATILFHSLRSQRNTFASTQVLTRTVTTPVMRIRRVSLSAFSSIEYRTQSVLQRLPSPFVRTCFRIWHTLTKLYEATNIQQECYYTVYVSRMLLQSFIHVHQLYRSSLFLPQPRVNTVWVVLFTINCWVPPLLSLVFRSNRPRTRLLCVVVNLALDVAALVVLAAIVIYPYAVVYDFTLNNFPRRLWYTDAWLIRTVNEFRMLAAVTPLDFAAKIAIALNVWRSLCVIPTILKKVDTSDIVPTPQGSSGTLTGEAAQPLPPVDTLIAVESSSRCGTGVLGSLVLTLLGAVVLRFHLQAHASTPQPHCGLQLEAWLVSKPACSFLEYRCVEPHQTGSGQELAAVFQQFEPSLVSYVSIRYCSHVEIPPEIRAFQNLLGIKIYNSTLARWDESAAVTAFDHPDLRFAYLIDVQMAAFPRGLMAAEFPPRFFDVEISRANLTALPEELDQLWPRGTMTLALEEIPFIEFPMVVARLQPSAVSLANSGLTTVPPALFENPDLNYVILNGNPLLELPFNVTVGPKFTWLTVRGTTLSAVPQAFATVHVDAQDTPFCATSSSSSPSPPYVDCVATLLDRGDFTLYPIDLEELLNAGTI